MYKENVALNSLQELVWYKTQAIEVKPTLFC